MLRRFCCVVAGLYVGLHHSAAQTNFITLAPDGAWTWFNDPRALLHHGTLFFGYVRDSDGRIVLSAFDPAARTRTDLWTSTLTQKDDHDNPGLLVMSDGRMLAIYSRHGTDHFFSYRTATATNPISALDWTEEKRVTTGAGVTYSNPFQLSAEGGRIYDFMRDLNFNPTVIFSTNYAQSWSQPRILIKTGTGKTRPYVKNCSNYSNRIDFLYTDGHPRDVTNSLYHAYYKSGMIHKTDDSPLKQLSDLPLLHDSGERGSVIYLYSEAATADFNNHVPFGRAWCWEIAYQSNGFPVCVFSVGLHGRDVDWSEDRIFYYYARWTGTNWQKRMIANAGRPLYQSERDYAGGICLDPEDPNVVYLSSNAAEPFNFSDIQHGRLAEHERYEIWRGVTADGGKSFACQPVTTNSPPDNLRPYVPRNHGSQPALIWFRGKYSSYTSHECAVVGILQ